jgi:AcrR family transcriptional regulator
MARNAALASSTPTARRARHAADSRRALLAAARRAFARHGYADTSLDDIVARARLTKGAFYHHFDSKAAVLEAVYVDLEEQLLARMKAAMAAAGKDPWTQMRAALEAFFDASSEPDYVRIVLLDAPRVLAPHHGRELDQTIGLGFLCELVEALRAARLLPRLPVVATARMLLATTGDLAIAMAHAADPARVRKEGTQVLLAMLGGLRAQAR